MTGLPLVLAAGIWLGGVPAALFVTPLIGACAVLSFGGLAGRLVGARWAPAAAAALALSLPEQYTSRGTFGEPLAQVLLFGGLCLRSTPAAHPPAARRPAAAMPGQDRVLAGLARLVLGLVVLVRIDGLSDILPAVPFPGLLLAARRRQAIPFGLGLIVGAGYGLADGYLKARPYLDLVAPSLRPLGQIAAVVARTLAASPRPASAPRRRGCAAGHRAQESGWWPGCRSPPPYDRRGLRRLRPPAAGRHPAGQYDQDSLYWVIWYIGLPAVLLGAFGLAVQANR